MQISAAGLLRNPSSPGVSPGEDRAKRRGFKKNPGLEKPAPILRELAYYNRE
jgi:hypothetical protein